MHVTCFLGLFRLQQAGGWFPWNGCVAAEYVGYGGSMATGCDETHAWWLLRLTPEFLIDNRLGLRGLWPVKLFAFAHQNESFLNYSPTSSIWHAWETRKSPCYRGVTHSIIWQTGPLCHDNEVLHENETNFLSNVFTTMQISFMRSMWTWSRNW